MLNYGNNIYVFGVGSNFQAKQGVAPSWWISPLGHLAALPCSALPCPALPCLASGALPCPALPCSALPCPVLPWSFVCPALLCPAQPCWSTNRSFRMATLSDALLGHTKPGEPLSATKRLFYNGPALIIPKITYFLKPWTFFIVVHVCRL